MFKSTEHKKKERERKRFASQNPGGSCSVLEQIQRAREPEADPDKKGRAKQLLWGMENYRAAMGFVFIQNRGGCRNEKTSYNELF